MNNLSPWSKKFLLAFGSSTLIFLMAVAILNRVVDPAGLFSATDYEYRIAQALAQGKHVGHPGNFDERLLQRRRAEIEQGGPLDHLVMGSSRALLIDQQLLPGKLRNIAVSGAVIQDHLALWQLWRPLKPKTVWLVLDPWLFNRNNDQKQWETLAAEYRLSLARISRETGSAALATTSGGQLQMKKIAQLFNFEYTRASWLKLTGGSTAGNFVLLDDDGIRDFDIIATAGNRIPDSATLTRTIPKINELADEFSRKPSYLFKNYYAIDAGYRQLLHDLLVDMQQQATVKLILAPLHPLVYERYTKSMPPFALAEIELRRMAKELGIQIGGSFSPLEAGCNQAAFYDGIHPMPDCMRHLLMGQ